MKSLIDNSVIKCDEIMDAVAKSYVMPETMSLNLNDKKATCKIKLLHFTHFFISNHIVIRNLYYLLLLHKTSKQKHIITILIKKCRVIMN